MSAQQRPGKYSAGSELQLLRMSADPLDVREHVLEQYEARLPADAVAPSVAWARSEAVFHPEALATHHHTPDRVRIYNHDGEYWAVFIIERGAVQTVYSSETHEHPPTRAYVRAHGPHYTEERGGR